MLIETSAKSNIRYAKLGEAAGGVGRPGPSLIGNEAPVIVFARASTIARARLGRIVHLRSTRIMLLVVPVFLTGMKGRKDDSRSSIDFVSQRRMYETYFRRKYSKRKNF